MEEKIKLILASSSKARQSIFNYLGLKYSVITSKVEENSSKIEPHEYVKELSKNKATSVQTQLDEKAIIIAADTVIYMDGKIYEKPKSKEEAFLNIKEINFKYANLNKIVK